jgi:hypothetical protein
MEPLSQIVNSALDEITNGQFVSLPRLGMTGLLNDFQYAWLKKLKISYKFEMLDFARSLCNGENKTVLKVTNSKSINDVRNKLSGYIKRWHKSDDRVILSLRFDGKKINAEWLEMEKYLALNEKDVAR